MVAVEFLLNFICTIIHIERINLAYTGVYIKQHMQVYKSSNPWVFAYASYL